MLVVRAPESADPLVTAPIPLQGPTQFQDVLARLRLDQPHPQELMWDQAGQFSHGADFVRDVQTLAVAAQLDAFNTGLGGLPDPTDLSALSALAQQTFGQTPSDIVASNGFQHDARALGDTIVAVMLAPQAAPTTLDPQAVSFRLLTLIARIASLDPGLSANGAVQAALSAPVVLLASIFPVDRTMIPPVGVADDWVVRQHISGYELGEIAAVENSLVGETRKHALKHTLATEQTLITETEQTTETLKEQQTTDRFDLKSEVDSTLKEDTSVKGGVSVKYNSSPWTVTANVDAAYQRSKTDASKIATDQARDVVQRASTKVTDRVRQQQTLKLTESLVDDEEHQFDNTRGPANVTGIYQWVNKVYRVQMFDIGPRVIFDITVPEPAALLWDLKAHPDTSAAPVPPDPFTAYPSQMDPDPTSPQYFGQYLAKYGVSGAPQAPAEATTVSATYAVDKNHDAKTTLFKSETLKIPANFQASTAAVTAQFDWTNAAAHGLNVIVGRQAVAITAQDMTPQSLAMNGETDTIPVAVETFNIDDYVLAIDIECTWTPEAKANWQLQVHAAIVQAYQQRFKDYQEQLSALALQATTTDTVTGTNPDRNRDVERTELKRSAVALLAGPTVDLLDFDALIRDQPPREYPRPNPELAERKGRIARFFEQALEWENMNYFFYPYFWGSKPTWYDRVLADDSDPLFGEFLRAGQARVVVPVRPGFQADIQFFLRNGGQLWGGHRLPDIHAPDYLPIAKEIQAAERPDVGTAGDWWELRLPTNQVYLRDHRTLPSWQVDGQWNWTPAG
jgi:hypothetical protein